MIVGSFGFGQPISLGLGIGACSGKNREYCRIHEALPNLYRMFSLFPPGGAIVKPEQRNKSRLTQRWIQ